MSLSSSQLSCLSSNQPILCCRCSHPDGRFTTMKCRSATHRSMQGNLLKPARAEQEIIFIQQNVASAFSPCSWKNQAPHTRQDSDLVISLWVCVCMCSVQSSLEVEWGKGLHYYLFFIIHCSKWKNIRTNLNIVV